MRAFAVLFAVVVAAAPALASPTRIFVPAPADLLRGESDGIGVTSRGRLFLAPKVSPAMQEMLPGGPAHVWAAASDKAGNIFLGTGPDGRIVKIDPAGRPTIFFAVDDPMVTSLAVDARGDLLAGTAPEGKIYRVKPDGRGSVWVDTDERYVWALAVGGDRAVYAGTGEKGLVIKIDPDGRASTFFDSDDAHIVSLTATSDGSLLAGGAGRGLVYSIAPDGRASVLHDDDLPEARAVVREADGDIVAAFLAQPEPERRPPAVRIQVEGSSRVAPRGDAVTDIDDRSGQKLEGIIEGLTESADDSGTRTRGRVVRIAPDGAVTELWRSSTEAPFSLALDDSGRAVFGAGEPARLYRVEDDGDVALVATLREGQVTALVRDGATVAAATSNPGALYRLEGGRAESGTYVARPIDAGGSADWGSIRWWFEGRPARVEFSTRTGNSSDPDGAWSAWSAPLIAADGSPIASPKGRFLQWRARVFGTGDSRIASVSVTAVSENRAPLLRELRLDPPASSTSSRVTMRWNALDPDGDPLSFEVQYQTPGESSWTTGARSDPAAPKPGDPASDPEVVWKEGKLVWDTTVVDEGVYKVRVVGSDAAANAPGEGREATIDVRGLMAVDRTPPELSAQRRADGGLEIVASDALSPIARLEIVADGRALFAPRPVDKVCDSKRETFRLRREEAGGPGERSIRAVDAAGNAAEAPVPPP